MVDILHLSELKTPEFSSEAEQLSKALDDLVVYNRSNTVNANGVSVYYPFANRDHMEILSTLYKTFGFAENYTAFMELFIGILQDDELASRDMSRAVMVQESDSRISVQLTPEQVEAYADATFYILGRDDYIGDAYTYLFGSSDVELSDDGKLYANYVGKIHKVMSPITGDKYNFMMNQVERTETHVNYHVRVMMESWEINRFPRGALSVGWLQLRTDIDGTNIQVLSVIPDQRPDESGFVVVNPPVSIYNYQFVTLGSFGRKPTYNSAGQLVAFEYWESSGRFSGMETVLINDDIETFRFILEDIDRDEEFYIIFSIMDVQGNRYSSNLIPLVFN